MYRIEVASGEETVFRTIEELAVAIRNGVVTPRARIYHHASQKWLPIGLHPHYKKALEMPAASASPAPVTSTTPVPTSSRAKSHPPSHPRPHLLAHRPEPNHALEPRRISEPKPMPAPAAEIPAPVQSPVITMQNEVLRDLPVISVPEPLPWTVKRSSPVAPTAPAHAPPMDAPAAHAPAVHAPPTHAIMHAPAPPAPAPHAPAPHTPAPRTTTPHAMAPHAMAPHAMAPRAMAPHAMAPHATAPHATVPHTTVSHAPASHKPVELTRPVEKSRDADREEPPLPRPTARRSRRMSGRPLLLLGAAAALVVGTHLALTATSSAPGDPSEPPPSVAGSEETESAPEPPAAVADEPAGGTSSAKISSAANRVTETPRVTIAPARVPMTPGPAFAGSVPARPGADSIGKPKAAIQAPAPEPAPAAASIAPAPAAIELALPGLPPDSLAPTARTGDTMGMKKILRALNGTKPAGAPAAP